MEKEVSKSYFSCLLILVLALASCRKVDIVYYDPNVVEGEGIYLLCEGNMGSNKASVDFLSYTHDTLCNNVYPSVNPKVVRDLGDVGNDIATYGGKLYMVINCSGKVEVTDRELRRITQINIPNCRNICFSGPYAYVTSYAGPVEIGNRQIGYVAKIDTASLQVVATCNVGYQPNEIEVCHGKIYVANSGGYLAPNYDSTVSVIDEVDFKELYRISVAKNLDALCLDTIHNALFVSSLGDYSSVQPALYRIDLTTESVTRTPIFATKMCLVGERLYYYSYSYGMTAIDFGILNTSSLQTQSMALPLQTRLTVPYGIIVDEIRGMLYVANSPSYTNPGYLYCYRLPECEGGEYTLLHIFRTGDIPGHFCLK